MRDIPRVAVFVSVLVLTTGAAIVFFWRYQEVRRGLTEAMAALVECRENTEQIQKLLQNNKDQLKSARLTLIESEEELKAAKIQIATIENGLEGKDKKLEKLKNVLSIRDNQLHDLNSELETFKQNAAEIEDKLKIRLERIHLLENERDQAQADLEKKSQAYDQIKADTEQRQTELENDLAEAQGTLSKNREETKKLQLRLQESEAQLQAARQTIAEGNEELKAAQSHIANYENALKSKEKKIENFQNTLFIRDNQVEDLSSELEAVKQTATEIEDKLKITSDRIRSLGNERDRAQADFEQNLKAYNQLESEAKQIRSELEAATEKLEQALKESRRECEELRQRLAMAKNRQEKIDRQKNSLQTTYEALVRGLQKEVKEKQAIVEKFQESLKVTFVDRILFGFSQVRIGKEGKAALDRLASVLASLPEGRIRIAGHADSVPVAEKYRYRFPSNWELSSARGAAVARYLQEIGGVDPESMEVVGLSHYHPVADNTTEEGRLQNRRVEITITPSAAFPKPLTGVFKLPKQVVYLENFPKN